MSLNKRLWVLLVPMAVTLALGTPSSVQAEPPAQPPPPIPSDACGASKDQVYTAEGGVYEDVSWKDSLGNRYGAGEWNSTGGANSLTLTAKVSNLSGYAEYTYPTMTFGVEPDSSCVDAPDTVTTKIVACNPENSGTRVTFTYTNTPENGRPRAEPHIFLVRWDGEASATRSFRSGEVADGESVSFTDGDSVVSFGFYLKSGTFDMWLITDDDGKRRERKLPNRLFVPRCGVHSPPPGDPRGGPNLVRSKPRAYVGKCYHSRVRVTMDGRKAVRPTRYRMVVNPKRGKTKIRVYRVAAGNKKVVVLRHQKNRTVVTVRFAGTTVKRMLKC